MHCTLYKGWENKHNALFPDIYYSTGRMSGHSTKKDVNCYQEKEHCVYFLTPYITCSACTCKIKHKINCQIVKISSFWGYATRPLLCPWTQLGDFCCCCVRRAPVTQLCISAVSHWAGHLAKVFTSHTYTDTHHGPAGATAWSSVMGKYQLWLGLKSRFELFWRFNLRLTNSIWTAVILFMIWLKNLSFSWKKKTFELWHY